MKDKSTSVNHKFGEYLKGVKEILSILWKASRILTFLLLFNHLIRRALWPIRAYCVKNVITIIGLSNQTSFDDYKKAMYVNLAIIFITFLANRIWWPLNSMTQALMLEKVGYETKLRIVQCAKKMSLSFFDSTKNIDVYSKALEQTDGRRPIYIVNSIFGLLTSVITLVVAVVPMIDMNLGVTILLLLSSFPTIWWENKFGKMCYEYDNSNARQKRLIDYLFKLYTQKTAMQEIHTFETQTYIQERYNDEVKSYNKGLKKLYHIKLLTDFPVWMFLQLAIIVSYYIIFSKTADGYLVIGEMSYFMAVAVQVQGGIKDIGSNINQTIDSSRYANNLIRLYDTVKDVKEDGIGVMDSKSHTITFEHVSFCYPNSESYALKDVSFTIQTPWHVLIVGENGSGKSTIIKLMLRFYDVSEGSILLDGKNINEYNLVEYRSLFTACFQDHMNYGFSFKDNIRIANPELSKTEYDEIVQKVELEKCRVKLPKGDETNLLRSYDEDGVELSGGEYNRLALGRAIAKKAPIVLMDEPTSALDARAEQKILGILNELAEERLSIMITHRLNQAAKSDYIIVMNKGEVIEKGSHQELMELQGEYHSMFMSQASRFMEGISLENG